MPARSNLSASERRFHADERERRVRQRTGGSMVRYQRALQSLAGGVSTALRRHARPYPLYFEKGCGTRLTDVDGNSYIDYTLAWGPTILGHAPDQLAQALSAQSRTALTFGAQHELEYEVAEALCAAIPCADLVCFANSGTEIVQVALRLARAATGRRRYVKFEGHYHGWDDSVLISYHPTQRDIDASAGRPIGAGLGQLPPETAVIARWNDRDSVDEVFRSYPHEISAVICEPLLANSGCIPPDAGFLEYLREKTQTEDALLIFDEVITGFRLALGGAQEYYGVIPDLATYGKAVGGGVCLSVLAGSRRYMDLIASGAVVHAGTMNGNPLSLAAAKVTLGSLSRGAAELYGALHRNGSRLRSGLEQLLRRRGFAIATNGEGPIFHLAFMSERARNYRDLLSADTALYSDFALAMLDEGVLVLPDGRWYISAAHDACDIDATLAAAERAVT